MAGNRDSFLKLAARLAIPPDAAEWDGYRFGTVIAGGPGKRAERRRIALISPTGDAYTPDDLEGVHYQRATLASLQRDLEARLAAPAQMEWKLPRPTPTADWMRRQDEVYDAARRAFEDVLNYTTLRLK